MATAMKVPTIFTAVDRFSHVVDRMSKSASAFGATAQGSAMRASRQLSSMGTSMLTAGVVMGAGIGYAMDEAMKYEAAIISLAAVTGTRVGSMTKDIEALGLETKRSVIDIAKSFENIGSKMSEYLKDPTALREIAKQSILMADASRMGLDESTDNLTSILNQFKLSYKDANRVVNKLSAGEDIGASTISESSDVVRQFAASARMAGANLEETIALVQSTTKTLGKDGVGRGFRNLMVDMNTGKGMDKNKQKALLMVGADINKIINPSTKFIDKLKEIKKLLSDKQAMGMFFKKTGFETGATFLGSFDLFEQYLKHVYEVNSAQEKADKNNASLAKRFKDLKAQVQFLAIKIGEHLIPAIAYLLDYISPMIKKITDWVKNNKRLVKAVFFLTVGLLLLGFATKAAAFYLTGYASALKIIAFATEAYTGILWFLSLSFEGMAVATTYATAALWSFLWPLGLFALSIWVIIDMVQHWEDWYEIILLCVGPLGWVLLLLGKIIKHSDNIRNKFAFEGWSGGIKAIGIMLEDLILSPLIGIFNILGRLTSFIPGVGSTFTELAADLDASRHKIAPELTVGNLNGASQFTNFGGITPQWDLNKKDNLAGMNGDVTQQMMAMLAKGVIDINLNAPPGVIDGVDKSQSTGVRVNLGSTIGQRGNQNGY